MKYSSTLHTVQLCTSNQECSDFTAGSVLRSASRYHALDETDIFGCACRHEFPRMFVNLKHGERYTSILHFEESV